MSGGLDKTQAEARAIEHDPHDHSREYIPLPGGWEVQTKGGGSSYRLLDKKTGERHLILSDGDWKPLQAFFTRFAHEVFEASRDTPPSPHLEIGAGADVAALLEAIESQARELAEARAEVQRVKSDREWIIGFNAGWEAAVGSDGQTEILPATGRRLAGLEWIDPRVLPGDPVASREPASRAAQPALCSTDDALLIVADALECFWNASIGSARNSQDSTALAISGSLSEGFAAVAARLRESAEPVPLPKPKAGDTETMARVITGFLRLRDENVTDPDERTDEEREESARVLLDLLEQASPE